MKHIAEIVVEPHGVKRPHQTQKLLLIKELRKMKGDAWDDDFHDKENKEKQCTKLEIADGWRRVHSKSCDVYGCTIGHDAYLTTGRKSKKQPVPSEPFFWEDDKVLVAKVLSHPFNVSTKKIDLTSSITLAEVQVTGSEEEAVTKAIQIASEGHKLSLDLLNKIKRPTEHGYTFDAIIESIMPYIIKHARRYRTHNFPMDDGIQEGCIGVMHAVRTDRAIAPFSSHAFRWIQTCTRRKAMTSGIIRHGEREGDIHGTKGVQINTFDGGKAFSSLQWGNTEVAEGVDLFAMLHNKEDEKHEAPLNKMIAEEDRRLNGYRARGIIEEAGLSEQQRTVICLMYALTDMIDSPYKVVTKNHARWMEGDWLHTGTEVARVMGCSRQRVGQQRTKSLEKMRKASERLGINA